MNEFTKTVLFIVVAVIILVLAFSTKPSTADLDLDTLVGDKTIGDFNPEDAKRLKIVTFGEDTSTLRDFEVAQDDNGLWILPSKNGYPADAEQQMGEAAGSLLDREVLAVKSNNPTEHEQYGVVDPKSPKLEAGQKGVGTRVTVADINDEPLVDLVIGKPVKDAEDQRYVREPNRDVVYVIEIDPAKLSTKFEDWIEDDLLKLNPMDIQEIKVNDYSANLVLVGFQPQIEWDRRGEYSLRYDSADSKWVVNSLKTYQTDAKDFVDEPLTEEQELNQDKIRDLKDALDDLLIVDVEQKPTGLSADLKAGGDFLKNNESISSLVKRGFAPIPLTSDELEILSSEGEVICTMKNGVEYVLRFGNLQVASSGEAEQGIAGENNEDEEDGVNRYLFVMVRFNEDVIEKPELEKLPELPAKKEPEANTAGESTGEPAEDGQPKTEDASSTAEPATDETSPASDTATTDNEGSDTATTDNEGDAAAGEEKTDDQATDESSDTSEAKDASSEELEKIIADRKRIEESNQRKLDEYKSKIDEGTKEVDELNQRFGDWYYVIANDIFQKIRLNRDDLVKAVESSDDESTSSTAPASSNLGAPGTAIPGLPNLPGN
jgi:hypothetical protein